MSHILQASLDTTNTNMPPDIIFGLQVVKKTYYTINYLKTTKFNLLII